MNKTSKGVLFFILLVTLMISVLTPTVSANSAEPPALVIGEVNFDLKQRFEQ